MNRFNRRISLVALPASSIRALVVLSLLGFALADGARLTQAWAGAQGHGGGKGHNASQGNSSSGGLGGSVGGALGGIGGAVGGTLGGNTGASTSSSASGQSSVGGGSGTASANAAASASASTGAASPAGGPSDPPGADVASIGPSVGRGKYVGSGAIDCSTEPDSCMGEMGTGLGDSAPLAAISTSGPTASGLHVLDRRSVDGVPVVGTSSGAGVPSDVLAVYSTAQLADLPPGALALEGGPLKSENTVDTLGWKAQVLTPVTGPMTAGGPVLADTASTSSDAAAWADQAVVGGYQIWMGNFVSEGEARRFWKKQVHRYPALLKKLKPTLSRIHPGTAVVARYRLLGGTLASRAAAEHVCGSILSRSPHNVCRVVLS